MDSAPLTCEISGVCYRREGLSPTPVRKMIDHVLYNTLFMS